MVSTRFAGLDGVTLEAVKLADVAREAGHEVVWFAGELEFEPGTEYPAAHFESSVDLTEAFFGEDEWSASLDRRLVREAAELESALAGFVAQFGVEVLVPQNVLAIPMQLPLAVGLATFLQRTGMPAVAHHHDFSWERPRYLRPADPGLLADYFPPVLPNLRHMVINSDAGEELARRTGAPWTLLPNVMDFERGPSHRGDGLRFRAAAGLPTDAVVLLQPTRLIRRKGIELTIELAARLADPKIAVVCTHPGDVDREYWAELGRLSGRRDVQLLLAPASDAGTLADAYAAADLVCYPSIYEGFGNALLEAFLYRRPVFVNRYSVYARDIAPTGVRCIEIDGAVTDDAIRMAAAWLADPGEADVAVEANYQVGLRHFSYEAVRRRFLPLVDQAARQG